MVKRMFCAYNDVHPSFAARVTDCVPRKLSAPGWFEMMTGMRTSRDSSLLMKRAPWSAVSPAPNGVARFIGVRG